MAKRTVSKFKAKTLVKAVAKIRSLQSQSDRLNKSLDTFAVKPIVGSKVAPAKEQTEYFFTATQPSTSAFKRHYEASVIARLKKRKQQAKLLSGVGSQSVTSSAWASLRQDALRKLAFKTKRHGRSKPRKSNFKAERTLPDGEILANIDRLQLLLGLAQEKPRCDVTFVSIDCEFIQYYGTQYVTEIGITTLKASDISNVPPGLFARGWNSKLKHHHMVVRSDKTRRWQAGGALFTKSQNVDGPQAKAAVETILRELVLPGSDHGYMVLVGHSTITDIQAMIECPELQFDIRTIGRPNLRVLNVFDTFWLGVDAKKAGAALPGLSLGTMANSIGIDPVYRKGNAIIGWHNASNDAAYTMMCLLLFAADWNVITGKAVRTAVAENGMRDAEANADQSKNTLPLIGETSLFGSRASRRKARFLKGREAADAKANMSASQSTSAPSWWSWLVTILGGGSPSNDNAGRSTGKRQKRKQQQRLKLPEV